jgi:hypothetical protein
MKFLSRNCKIIKTFASVLQNYWPKVKLSVGFRRGWSMVPGPRALGNRSILGDPRNSEMQQKINLSIKFRESFRPFAP